MISRKKPRTMKLFSQGKSPIEVRIELNVSTEKVETFYKDYWKLIGLYQLRTYYDTEIKENLPSFLKLFKKVKKSGISEDDIVIALSNMNKLPLMEMAVTKKGQVNSNV